MDLDTTVRGITLTHEAARKAFEEICAIQTDDDFTYSVVRTSNIRKADKYPGIRVHLKATYPPLSMPLTVDVTTGDKIVPGVVLYPYRLAFDNTTVDVFSYPTATVLAEKLETVLSRGVTNTRPRDFYDIHMLWRLRRDDFTINQLLEALEATTEKRRSIARVTAWKETLPAVVSDESMLVQWATYSQRFPYVGTLTLEEACATVAQIMSELEEVSYGDAAVEAI